MTIRDDLRAFLAEKPFSNLLTPEGIDALVEWVREKLHQESDEADRFWLGEIERYGRHAGRDDLSAKLRRLDEAGFTLEGSPYIEDQYGRWSTAVIKIGDLPEAIDAAIAELDKQEESAKNNPQPPAQS